MFLGIEIGGTKLQLGIGSGKSDELIVLERVDAEPGRGAEGIRQQILQAAGRLIQRHNITAVGIGFGGPVDTATGRTIKSHQVDGWEDFPLADWCQKHLGLPTVVANDSNLAGLAEARLGAGRGHGIVFYTNVGSGIGGALVIDGEVYSGPAGTAVEPGHLRPGPQAEHADETVESIASGWAIGAAAQARVLDPASHPLLSMSHENRPIGAESVRQRLIEHEEADERDAADFLTRCEGVVDRITAKMVAQAAADGNRMARQIFDRACRTLGWAIAQVITIAAPQIVVVGGGVSLAEERLFLEPVRRYVDRYAFPPLRDSFQIVPAKLGEEVVVHGALALADGEKASGNSPL